MPAKKKSTVRAAVAAVKAAVAARGPVILRRTFTASCTTYATFDTTCPLCGVRVPAKTTHRCHKEE